MAEKTLSVFGHIMNALHISTGSLAHAIHVDPSLVSKWKSGARTLSGKSIYFEDIIAYFMENASAAEHSDLGRVLSSLSPGKTVSTPEQTEYILRQILSGSESLLTSDIPLLFSGTDNVASSLTFSGNDGKRRALEKLLDYAEQMQVPGQLTFMDAGNFIWLTEDPAFAENFVNRVSALSAGGFQCRFMIHYDSAQEEFIRFFTVVNSLIFHSNINWCYLPYFNSPLFNISISVLNQTVSLISISSRNQYTSSTLVTNNSMVLAHEGLIQHVLDQCSPVFHSFKLIQFSEIVKNIQVLHRRSGIFYCILSSPAFIAVNRNLLTEILKDNKVSEDTIAHCLEVSQTFRSITSDNFRSGDNKAPFIFIFRYHRLVTRATRAPFISRSLSLICNQEIVVSPSLFAKQLRLLANALLKYDNLRIILTTDEDQPAIPSIDCWNKQNTWLLQMDENGFRYCEDSGIINAASKFMAYCIQDIPSQRKEPGSVRHYLLDLARELETQQI